ncbi:MAG: glycosyltransferase family 2 protein [Selenomonadaceae bacterium]|nr:glycosyltransferase family 2 protein [Selenomonadaceae bacterium]
MTPTVSVIVPMYNAENFIKPALESLLTQTFTDFEVILIDDCSTDRTLEIAKTFDDPRIRLVVNEKNLGNPGSARNVGLEHAIGEYVYFMDDDDLLLPNCLETFIDAIGDNDVAFDVSSLWADNGDAQSIEKLNCQVVRRGALTEISSDPKQRIWSELVNHKMHYPPWLFLYRRALLKDIRFPDCVAEDVFFLLDVLLSTDRIVKFAEPLYIWRVKQTSASQTINRLSRNIEGAMKLSAYLERRLSAFDDPMFVGNVTFSVVNGVLMDYALQFFNDDPIKAIEETERALRPTFGGDALFVTNLIRGYMFKCLGERRTRTNENHKTN